MDTPSGKRIRATKEQLTAYRTYLEPIIEKMRYEGLGISGVSVGKYVARNYFFDGAFSALGVDMAVMARDALEQRIWDIMYSDVREDGTSRYTATGYTPWIDHTKITVDSPEKEKKDAARLAFEHMRTLHKQLDGRVEGFDARAESLLQHPVLGRYIRELAAEQPEVLQAFVTLPPVVPQAQIAPPDQTDTDTDTSADQSATDTSPDQGEQS